jgi:hypothetical protein
MSNREQGQGRGQGEGGSGTVPAGPFTIRIVKLRTRCLSLCTVILLPFSFIVKKREKMETRSEGEKRIGWLREEEREDTMKKQANFKEVKK